MKIQGKTIYAPAVSDVLVLSRPDGKSIAFRAHAVMNRQPFDDICPYPKLPMKTLRGGEKVVDTEHKNYNILIQQHAKQYQDWMILTGLKAVDPDTKEDIEIEWETINMSDPTTYGNWMKELESTGFSDIERMRIHGLVIDTNSLTEARLTEARESFLRERAKLPVQSSSQSSEQSDTPSGEPANDSESDHQESNQDGMTSTNVTGGSEPVLSNTV